MTTPQRKVAPRKGGTPAWDTTEADDYLPNSLDPRHPDGFAVTCEVGYVVIGHGDESPSMAAFRLIHDHDAPGVYRFPMRNGQTCVVAIEHEGEAQ